MTGAAIDKSQQTAAKVAGFAYLITFAIAVGDSFSIFFRMVTGNAAETARNILAHETLFRIGIAGYLLYCVAFVVLTTALYVTLKPVNGLVALLAAFWRLIWVLMWLGMVINLFDALRLLRNADLARAFEPERLQTLASFILGAGSDFVGFAGAEYYYVGLLFCGLASTLCACLWFKSRYIPRALAAYGVVSCAFCVMCTVVYFIFPGFDKVVSLGWFDTPMGLFDLALGLWLSIKGLNPPREAAAHA